jgi:hypothetical protein
MPQLIVEPFRTYQIALLIAQGVQAAQVQQVSHVPASYASVAKPPGLSMTVRDGEAIVLCGGILPAGPGYGVLWAVLSATAGKHMLFLHRATRRFIDLERWRRLEASVEVGFPAGERWLQLLGFKHEGPLEAFGANGEDHVRYARITR